MKPHRPSPSVAGLLARSCLTALFLTWAQPMKAAESLPASFVTPNGIRMVLIRAGSFQMGNDRPTPAALGHQIKVFTRGGEDERPVHPVTLTYDFYISETEVTAMQFTKYQEDHVDASLFSPAATGMSWEDAAGFCAWMNWDENTRYEDESDQAAAAAQAEVPGNWRFRLPTEAEWEYVARAGSADHFSSGATPPASGEPNAWGVKNMHTDAMEWVHDWHGDYPDGPQVDPVGPASGVARVVRGGGLNTRYHDFSEKYPIDGQLPFYRRSANRAGAPPGWRGRHNVGFRLVAAPLPATAPRPVVPPPTSRYVRQENPWVGAGPDPRQPWFRQRDALPVPPCDTMNPAILASGLHHTVHGKNHNPALVVAPNGDLLLVAFSASSPEYEDLTDVTIIGARLRFGAGEWDLPGPFVDLPGVKDIGPVLTREGSRLLFAWGGGGLDGILFRWQSSDDNGATWGPVRLPVILGRRGDYFPQPISNFLRGADGTLYLPCDGSGGNSFLWASRDEGITWSDPGGRTGGRHTVFVLRKDGAILGLGGKASDIDGYMPQSVSRDGGRTWEISRTRFPMLGPSGQKPALIRLASGRLFLAGDWLNAAGEQPPGINKTGAYVALSDDEGATWTVKDLPGLLPHYRWVFRGHPGYRPGVLKDGTLGYCIAAQAADGVIHLVNSSTQPVQHWELNEAWILDPAAGQPGSPPAVPVDSAVRSTRENHPDDSPKAEWGVRPDARGRMLAHGRETHWHPSGRKEYEVVWSDGAKTGTETCWDEKGRVIWRREHRADGTNVWTQFRPDGSKRHESHWRGLRSHGPAREWDRAGRLVAEHEFVDGELRR